MGQTVPEPRPEHYATGKPDELVSFQKDELLGFVDATGEVIIQPQFSAALEYSDGLARVCKDQLFSFIDRTGEFVIAPSFQHPSSFSEGLAGVPLEGKKWGFIDKTGKTVPPAKYDWVYDDWVYGNFREGIVRVSVAGRAGYINEQSEWVW
jgi:hypothetical protein